MSTSFAEQIIPKQQQQKYTCVGCKSKFETIQTQRAHFKTSWHLYNLKRRVCKLEPIDIESFTKIQEVAETLQKETSKSDKSQQKQEKRATEEKILKQIREDKFAKISIKGGDEEEDDESDWEEVDDDKLVDEDYDDEEIETMLAQVVSEDTCLFCNRQSLDIPSNLVHMNLHHGFFIPEEQYLIDLEGMMKYLGFKVGAGATCLWCNKQFTTAHGVRLHMQYKDHCKILYDQKQAIDEFKDFYDYTMQEHIPMKSLHQLDIVRKRSRRYNDRSMIAAKSNASNKNKQIVSAKERIMLAVQKKNIKKFNSQRAKNLLRVGMTNNMAVRGRLRQQNPI